MNLLFVVDSLSNVAGANVNIVRTLTKIFKSRKCNVYVLAKSDCKRPVSEELKDEFDYAYLLPSDRYEIIPNIYKKIKTKNKKLKEMIWLLNHPGIFLKGIDSVLGDALLTRIEYSKNIEKICEERKIDVVIGVSSPYSIARAVSKANTKALKTLYQLDPYTNNYTLASRTKEKRKKIERQTIERLDILFLPDFIRNDILESNVYSECDKFVEANLPGIIVDNIVQRNSAIEKKEKKNEINFVFAGKLYEDIRNPKPLLQLFTILPSNFRLHILGSGCENLIMQFKNELGDRLIYHGLVAKTEADNYVNKADVLVNIDNTIRNQMPSKIVDYISQQKRIINICMDRECLAAKLLSMYPNGVNICINEKSMVENAELINDFLKKDIDRVTVNEIVEKYKKYTDKYVADTVLETISNANRYLEGRNDQF